LSVFVEIVIERPPLTVDHEFLVDPFQSLGAEQGNTEDILAEALGKKKKARLLPFATILLL